MNLELPKTFDGKRRRLRRVVSAYPGTHDTALAELRYIQRLMAMAGSDPVLADEIASVLMTCNRGKPLPEEGTLVRRLRSGVPNATSITVGDYLQWWIEHRQIDEHTRMAYASHIRIHLQPGIGHIPLALLNTTHIEAMFGHIRERNAEVLAARSSPLLTYRESVHGVRLTMPATMTRIKATLRKALNDAVSKYRIIDFNPAQHVEMQEYDRPTVRVWTEAAVKSWQESGYRPSPVMVWTPEQAGHFLDYAIANDPELYALFLIVILAGPRRGEAAGIRTDEVDLTRGVLTFSHQIATLGYQPVYKKVKTRSGDRSVFIDHKTTADLALYWELRQQWQKRAGSDWPRTVRVAVPVPGGLDRENIDLFFRRPDGTAWHPFQITSRFYADTAAAGLPPIRFHDGRHAAATYLKAAGGDLLDMKKKLGHASITVTADTYPAGLEEIDRALAERTAALIPRNPLVLVTSVSELPPEAESRQKARPKPALDLKSEAESERKPSTSLRSKKAGEANSNLKRSPATPPEKARNAPLNAATTGSGNRAKHRPDLTKTQGAQRNSTIPPAVFLAPTSASASGAEDMQLRPRRNRYPRDLK